MIDSLRWRFDLTLWDVLGRALDVPVHEFLGGRHHKQERGQ